MKSAEILELIRAGYTKEEIAAMDTDTPAAAPDPAPAPAAAPDPAPAPAAAPDPAPAPAPAPAAAPAPAPAPAPQTESEKLLAALGMKFDNLTKAIQAQNVNTIEGGPAAPTTEQILAAIINPHLNDKTT